MAKNNPTKKQIDAGDIEACVSVKSHRTENVNFIVTNCKDRFKL